jgi:tetratricopeptide (TPR) repeat protein
VQRRAFVDARRLFAAADIAEDDRDAFYPTSWLAVHYLMNHRHAAFLAYELALARRPPDPEAWAHAFPDLPPEKLDDELASYVDGGQYELLVYPFKPPATRIVAERTLDDADTHATRALLIAASSHQPGLHRSQLPAAELRARAEREAGEALRLTPGHLLAQAVRSWQLADPVDLDAARATARAHPDEWMAWLLVAKGLGERGSNDGLQEALQRALALAASDPAVTLPLEVRKN